MVQPQYEGQYEVIGSTSTFDIIKPLTFEAERYFGSGTEWCTVANIDFFERYMKQGPLFIVYPKNGDKTKKMQFHFESNSFADYQDNVCYNGDDCIYSVIENENDIDQLLNLCTKIWGNSKFNVLASQIEALKTMTKIPDGYFIHSKIKKIIIPDNIISIGKSAFRNCSSLTSVTIPNSVTSIEESAFNNCSSLTSVTIPDSVTSIGYGAFSYCSILASVTIPNNVTSIEESAFNNCSSLTSVTIPDSVTSIGGSAFQHCDILTSVTIPDSVTSIGYGAFDYSDNLRKVIAPSRFAKLFKMEYNIDIIPSDRGNMGESIGRKRIFVTEEQYNKLTELLKEDTKYYVDPTKVKIVKKFLDIQFKRGSMDSMGSDGYPKRMNIFAMKGNNGDVVKNLSLEQMVDLLEDKFHHIFTERDKRDRFFKQILKDWYNKKITKEGLLSTYMF